MQVIGPCLFSLRRKGALSGSLLPNRHRFLRPSVRPRGLFNSGKPLFAFLALYRSLSHLSDHFLSPKRGEESRYLSRGIPSDGRIKHFQLVCFQTSLSEV